jgi:hypothetical protein
MSIYEYIPVNEQPERFNLSKLPNSPMSEGRVNPMFPLKLISPYFAFFLMIEIGSSPERIKDDTKSRIRLQDHWVKLQIYWPVSWFVCKWSSSFKFVNLSISGGIGPIQSQDKTAKKGRWCTVSPWSYLTLRYAFKIIGWNCTFTDLSAGSHLNQAPAISSIWRFRVESALYKVNTKQRKKGDGELVHHGLIWRWDTPSRSLGEIVHLLTCQLVLT